MNSDKIKNDIDKLRLVLLWHGMELAVAEEK
jgi:hypothetical protein